MAKNPYQAPKSESLNRPVPQYRSFRLAPSASGETTPIRVGTFRGAIVIALSQQVPLLVLSALILDGGMILRRIAIASIAFWGLTLIIFIRRRVHIPDSDILLVKWGYFPILLATCILWAVASAILYARG